MVLAAKYVSRLHLAARMWKRAEHLCRRVGLPLTSVAIATVLSAHWPLEPTPRLAVELACETSCAHGMATFARRAGS
jgi:hypothetical protein